MGDALAIAEQRGESLRPVSREAVTVAAELATGLGGSAHALILSQPGAADGAASLGANGADTVYVAEHAAFDSYLPEVQARVIADFARGRGYSAVVFAATPRSKDLAPRVAALLDVPLASDVTGATARDGVVEVRRPVFAGKAFARIEFEASPALLSIRPNAVKPAGGGAEASVESVACSVDSGEVLTTIVGFEAAQGGALDVAEATVVVAGGRGMKGPEHWSLLEGLVEAIGPGTGLGASRAVVDAGWRPHGEQVGQTGKTVAPVLYFAIGISGAIQHLAGMRTAGTIVAVNKDADAPIFQVADYGVVGDLFEIVPRLAQEISSLRQSE